MTHQTERLQIEPLGDKHAEGLFAALDDERVGRYLGGPAVTTLDALTERIAALLRGAPPELGEEWLNWVVKLAGTIIGRIEATVIDERVEIAYVFGPRWWGHGYAAEATTWMMQHLRTARDVTEFWATVEPANRASRALLERLEFEQQPADAATRLSSYDPGDLIYRLA